MPIRKKGDIEIELDNGEGEMETFTFLPLGLTGIFGLLKDGSGNMFDLHDDTEKNKVEIGDKMEKMIGKNADKIFTACMERCISHKIINRESLHERLSDPSISKTERKEIEQNIQDADYYISDFSMEEQAHILDKLMGTESIQEGSAEARNFQGDQ